MERRWQKAYTQRQQQKKHPVSILQMETEAEAKANEMVTKRKIISAILCMEFLYGLTAA